MPRTVLLIAALLLLCPAAGAEETQTLGGPGLILNNMFGIKPRAIEKIAIAPVAPNTMLKDKVAADADPLAVQAFEELSSLKIVDLTKDATFGVRRHFYNRSRALHLQTPEKIIAAGEKHGVEAFWGASVFLFEDRKSHVKLKVQAFLYSAKTGKRFWERTFYREQRKGGFKLAYENIVTWSISVLAEDGIGEILVVEEP